MRDIRLNLPLKLVCRRAVCHHSYSFSSTMRCRLMKRCYSDIEPKPRGDSQMQKKLIALAVAGLVSGAAFAQSNVVIYGVADAGYVYGTDSYLDNTKSIHKMFSGGQSGSRLGFKGTEDLGNGLAATFRLESGINIDNGTPAQNGGTFSRWATVGLKGNSWGEIQMGRRDTFSDELIGGFDATTRSTTAQASPIMKDTGRWDNFFAYISPNWSGLTVKAGVSTDINGQEVDATPGVTANTRGYALAAQYVNAGLKLGASYDRTKNQKTTGYSPDTGNQWTVAAGYDFKVVALSVEYGKINYAQELGEVRDVRTQYTIGAMVPFGPMNRLGLQYAHGKDSYNDAFSDDTQKMWGILFYHDMSKRTNLYVSYGQIRQDQDNRPISLVGIDSQGTYQKAFMAGIRHQF
ncbi:MAG: porin [Propionivibrio sp.]